MTRLRPISILTLALLVVIALAGVGEAQTQGQQGQQWQRVHGTVQSVSGNTVTIKTDDGKMLTVDASQVSGDIRRALTTNEGVTLIGFAGADATKFTARFIQQDSSDPARRGAATTASAGEWKGVHGTVQSVSGNTITFKTDDGKTLTVDATKVAADIRGSLKPNDAVTLVGFAGSDPTKFAAEYVQKDVAGQTPPAAGKDWQRVHGTVQSVSGNTVTFKADDGRILTVDAAQVGANIRGALTANEGVTLIGFAGSDASKFTAHYIQQDSSDRARVGQAPAASPSAPASTKVDEKAWQRIHGTVSAVSGTSLTLKADDGRMIAVDMKDVGEQVRTSLATGEGVTVIGFYRGNQNNVTAQYVQKDASAGSASPPSGQQKK